MQVDAQTLQGRWWIAGKPETRMNGTLEIETSGRTKITLFLDDEHNSFDIFPIGQTITDQTIFKLPRLVGLLHNGKVVTADNVSCHWNGWVNGITKFACHPTYICLSRLDFGTDDLKLTNIFIEIDGIDEFIYVSGLKYKEDIKTDEQNKLTSAVHDITYTHPSHIELFTDDDISLHAHFGYRRSFGLSEASIKQTTRFRLNSETPLSLPDWWLKIIGLNEILCVLYGQPLPLKSVQSAYKLEGKEVFLDFISYSEPNPQRDIKPNFVNLLFRRTDAKDITDGLLKEFLKLREEYHLIFYSFFSSKFADNQYIATRFFMITKALEGFHRLLRCNNNKTRKRIGLKTRLDELLADFETLSNCSYQWGDISKRVTSFRDQEAHLMKTSQNYDASDMHQITQKLHVVFAILFLAEATKRANHKFQPEWLNRNSWITQNLPVME
jgi:hypothetical protein